MPARPDGIRVEGAEALLALPRCALLLSRTPRRPVPATPWVRAVCAAVGRLRAAGAALVTGAGREAFDVALVSARDAGVPALVALERAPDAAWWIEFEALLPERRLLAWPVLEPGSGPKAQAQRDMLMAQLADRACAVHVRSGGRMAELAAALRARGCPVEGDGKVAGGVRGTPATPFSGRVIADLPPSWSGSAEWLTHFTREPDGAWPDEARADYAAWLAHGALDTRREAWDALRHILTQGRILGGARMMPGRQAAVSFTARPPSAWPELMKWRRGLRRWTFRPYGLSVRRADLEALGARQVQYLEPKALRALSPADRLFAQQHAPPKTDWSAEAEWRLRGDLDLRLIPKSAMHAWTWNANEARQVEREFGIPAVGWR